ncbi:hypothetical protein G8C93_08345, partial [Cellulosimicrobium cellulans]|uniref:hypothetical protein n=1 Tax=Cellulosimicrobium cellulans TaxID=1710 RepID=UPI003907F2A0|nr:hypothetical protein [Cellulosimicrobium cellulans]
VVVVPGRSAGASSGPTQPIPVTGGAPAARDTARPDGRQAGPDEDEQGWTVSGEHRATYVPVAPAQPSSTPIPKPYEPGPGRDGAP